MRNRDSIGPCTTRKIKTMTRQTVRDYRQELAAMASASDMYWKGFRRMALDADRRVMESLGLKIKEVES